MWRNFQVFLKNRTEFYNFSTEWRNSSFLPGADFLENVTLNTEFWYVLWICRILHLLSCKKEAVTSWFSSQQHLFFASQERGILVKKRRNGGFQLQIAHNGGFLPPPLMTPLLRTDVYQGVYMSLCQKLSHDFRTQTWKVQLKRSGNFFPKLKKYLRLI